MVFATRCPNPACKKYQLVESDDRGKTIPCLICKKPIAIPPETVSPPIAKSVPIPAKPTGRAGVNLDM